MFLNEVVLGKEHYITRDDWTLTAPPVGYDSIVAKGRPVIVCDCIDIVRNGVTYVRENSVLAKSQNGSYAVH